ncbi:hypothetical protein BKA70DRAFT_1406635 [Coprinopsis sp. MPI-PUGE-AT-0042]|nr:hypothetical protein BKA70DRAFT_1406635 [Coprinopsis sp. MPI-PUGE-AT-0042]
MVILASPSTLILESRFQSANSFRSLFFTMKLKVLASSFLVYIAAVRAAPIEHPEDSAVAVNTPVAADVPNVAAREFFSNKYAPKLPWGQERKKQTRRRVLNLHANVANDSADDGDSDSIDDADGDDSDSITVGIGKPAAVRGLPYVRVWDTSNDLWWDMAFGALSGAILTGLTLLFVVLSSRSSEISQKIFLNERWKISRINSNRENVSETPGDSVSVLAPKTRFIMVLDWIHKPSFIYTTHNRLKSHQIAFDNIEAVNMAPLKAPKAMSHQRSLEVSQTLTQGSPDLEGRPERERLG